MEYSEDFWKADRCNVAREKRDSLLAQTDFMFSTTDRPQRPSDQAWKDYRQALRDVPQQAGFPDNIFWPVRPDVVINGVGVTRV